MPLLSLVLSHQGIDETLIGLNTAVYFLAVFAVAPLASRLMRTRGPALLMLVSILAMAVLFILLRIFPTFGSGSRCASDSGWRRASCGSRRSVGESCCG